MKKPIWILALAAMLPLAQALANNGDEQLARERARAAVMAAEQGDNLKPKIIEEPARRYYDWGAVLNKSFEVMAVTPTSDAAKMGIQKGDQVLSINGKLTERRDLKEVLAQFSDLDDGDVLSVMVQRGKDKLSFSSKVHFQVMPAWRLEIQPKDNTAASEPKATGQCGRISVFFTPPQAHDLYPAFVNTIDGEGVLRTKDSFKLSPGDHDVAIHELINDYRLTYRGGGMELAKHIKIHVEANNIYYLAAKFIPEKRFKTYRDEYWEPVVWKVATKACD
ncbi:PDZ domain-containing protein [Gallaecimonas kandeliae]|uniref:PDZ domain-containing protein n=1 Tax=Gallaecimonas kandeliae TaxID=3029055 RepID=UPI0026499811|nr:PDZ domain-containing protein [Gallaecimonas kandeliae]WKE65722.1 PDZ domain-containing protein [Gallaecimonas kandeliae]